MNIPFKLLPEAKFWQVGKNYRAKVVLKEIGADETGANFEVVDATGIDPTDADNRRRWFISDGGSYGSR